MNSIIGQNIKKIRLYKKIKQKELSTISGVSQSTITEIENGVRQNLRGDNLLKVAKALGVSINDLLGISDKITDLEELFKKIIDNCNFEIDNTKLSENEVMLLSSLFKSYIGFVRIARGDTKSQK